MHKEDEAFGTCRTSMEIYYANLDIHGISGPVMEIYDFPQKLNSSKSEHL